MRTLFSVLFLVISFIEISACKCIGSPLAQQYLQADVVGVAKIIKVYDNNYEQRTYKADIEFQTIYKGEKFRTLIVRGLIRNSHAGSCEIDVEPGEKLLLLLEKHNGSYSISSCSPKYRLSEDEKGTLETLSKTFEYLDKNKDRFRGLEFTTCFDELQKGDKSELSNIKNFSPERPFAIYKVKINDSFKIEEIQPVTAFGNNDKLIENILKHNMSVDIPLFSKNSTQKEFLILLLYFEGNVNKQYAEVINSEW